ncbi:MAG: peptide chain release factor 2 [Bacilli bacterium]|nr:peptide chain release factor 2 [Bacilli bacterium]
MDEKELAITYEKYLNKINNIGGHFDPKEKKQKLKELDKIMNDPNFWNDRRNAENIINEFNTIKTTLEKAETIKNDIEFHLENLKSKDINEETTNFSKEELNKIGEELKKIEIEVLLNNEYDKNDAVLEIHSGAGGTEACDWANMLYRMYSKWILKKGYKEEIVDRQPGLEAGIKSMTIIVSGTNAYGYLKNEKGIHRLVRISPFDSGARRHTSFASISVTPVIDDKVNVEINPNDLKIDVFHSSGAGGQSVNTTDSAVRITHLPTGIVVTCQNERSQVQNKDKAMQILRSKLFELETEAKKEEIKELKGEQKDINFGSQIRSYVMHPYSLVKDHRTNTEDTNVGKVLDGEIDEFINSNLRRNAK